MTIKPGLRTNDINYCCLGVTLLLCFIILNKTLYAETLYCLETKKEMTADLRDAISNNIDILNSSGNLSIKKIQYCWNWRERNTEGINSQNEMGQLLIQAINNPKLNKNLQWSCFLILEHVAPTNVYKEVINYLEVNAGTLESRYKFSLLSSIFKMRAKAAVRSNEKYADKDINKVIDANRQLFDEQSPALSGLIYALAIKYPLEYHKAKQELINLNLFDLSRKYKYGNGLFDFQDPRALEDDEKYGSYLAGRQYTSAAMFTSLKKHLELEFKPEWLEKIETNELRILRNAIYASYGYKFTNENIQKYFYAEDKLAYICRNGRCGKTDINFDEKLLNEIDKKNIALINRIERIRASR